MSNSETITFNGKEYQGRWIEIEGTLYFVVDESLETRFLKEAAIDDSPLGTMVRKGIFLFAPAKMLFAEEKELGTYLLYKISETESQVLPA